MNARKYMPNSEGRILFFFLLKLFHNMYILHVIWHEESHAYHQHIRIIDVIQYYRDSYHHTEFKDIFDAIQRVNISQ